MNDTGSGTILEISGLRKWYGRVEALRDLNLRVERGQVYGFLGPNGAGKTTAIRVLLGLTPATGGQVRLFGEAPGVRTLSRVGALVESPSAYGHLTGRENLRVLARLRGSAPAQLPEVLARVGLTDAADRPVRGYSLGMRGRLSIAAVLLGEPELLLLDEPTNGLDPAGIREVRDLIRSLPGAGHTVMLSSHLLAEIEQTATHVGIIAGGVTRFQGPLSELQARAGGALRVEVDRPEEARRVLTGQGLARMGRPQVRQEGRELVLDLSDLCGEQAAGLAAEVNRALVLAGHHVSRLMPARHTLEELFLNLVESPEPSTPASSIPASREILA